MLTLHGLELFYCKNYFNLTKIFVLIQFKMAASQTECSSLEQRSVIKFLLAKMCKPCEVYKRMCHVYGEACFNQFFSYKWAKHGFATTSQSQNNSPWSEKHTELLVKKKDLYSAVSKEGQADSLLGHY